ncbi:MAG: hypothetical protein AAGC55_02490 [Myxococcota bacterium]
MIKKTIGILGALTILSGLAVGVAQADIKTYPGSMCVVYSGSGDVYNFSAIGNNSTTTPLKVDCTAVRDTHNSVKSGWIKVQDRHSSQAVECSMASIYVSGSGFYGWTSSIRASGGNSANWQTLSFGSLGANTTSHLYYSCSIPPRTSSGTSFVGTFQIDEN